MIVINQPAIPTQRLRLRPFCQGDATDVQRLAGERDVARNTLRIPHPYPDGAAETWIASLQELFDDQREAVFAVEAIDDGRLVGAIGLEINSEHRRAELGYWIGKPYWGRGYATEAAEATLRYGFEQLQMNRIFSHYLLRNEASRRVMQKIGMTCEGTFREHIVKWGEALDIVHFAILRSDYHAGE